MELGLRSPLLSFLLIQCGSFLFGCPLLFPPHHLCCSMQAPQAEDSVGHMSTSVVCEMKSFRKKVCCVAWGVGSMDKHSHHTARLGCSSGVLWPFQSLQPLLFCLSSSPGAPVHDPPLEDRTLTSSSLPSFTHCFLQGWELQKMLDRESPGVGDSALDLVPEARFFIPVLASQAPLPPSLGTSLFSGIESMSCASG